MDENCIEAFPWYLCKTLKTSCTGFIASDGSSIKITLIGLLYNNLSFCAV